MRITPPSHKETYHATVRHNRRSVGWITRPGPRIYAAQSVPRLATVSGIPAVFPAELRLFGNDSARLQRWGHVPRQHRVQCSRSTGLLRRVSQLRQLRQHFADQARLFWRVSLHRSVRWDDANSTGLQRRLAVESVVECCVITQHCFSRSTSG